MHAKPGFRNRLARLRCGVGMVVGPPWGEGLLEGGSLGPTPASHNTSLFRQSSSLRSEDAWSGLNLKTIICGVSDMHLSGSFSVEKIHGKPQSCNDKLEEMYVL